MSALTARPPAWQNLVWGLGYADCERRGPTEARKKLRHQQKKFRAKYLCFLKFSPIRLRILEDFSFVITDHDFSVVVQTLCLDEEVLSFKS
jgi:hypothetical protein